MRKKRVGKRRQCVHRGNTVRRKQTKQRESATEKAIANEAEQKRENNDSIRKRNKNEKNAKQKSSAPKKRTIFLLFAVSFAIFPFLATFFLGDYFALRCLLRCAVRTISF